VFEAQVCAFVPGYTPSLHQAFASRFDGLRNVIAPGHLHTTALDSDGMQLDWSMIFDGWTPVGRTLVLGLLAYFALVLLLRISGKRTLSKMNAFDFVVTVALGSTLASVLLVEKVSLVQGVTALGLLIALQLVNTFVAVRWPWYQRLLKAEPTLVFYRGRLLEDPMLKQRVTREEILAAIRAHGYADPAQVGAVVLETEGTLSVIGSDAGSPDALARLGVNLDPVTPSSGDR
jgi:uncharacterized membrane protein YcaP (DUF421 family)